MGRDLVRPRPVQQHQCAPRCRLHSPHRRCPSARLLFSACDGKVAQVFKIPQKVRKDRDRRSLERMCRSKVRATEAACECVRAWMRAPRLRLHTAPTRRRNQLLDGGNVKRHRAAAVPADSHHDAAPLGRNGVPVHGAIIPLTGRGGWLAGWGY